MASFAATALRSPIGRLRLTTTCVQQNSRALSTYKTSCLRESARPVFGRIPHQRTSYSTVVLQDRSRGRTGRILTSTLLALGSFAVGGYFALTYAPPLLTSLVMGSIPTDEDSLKFTAPDEWTQEIDDQLRNCKLATQVRETPGWKESRPHQKMPKEIRQHNLMAGTLATPDTVPVPPIFFNKKDGSAMVAIYYIGSHVSGHPGIVHGGFLAALLDEGLALCAFPALPNKMGVTAQLDISYKKPTLASQFIVLAARTTKAEGRKAWSEGQIYTLEEFEKEVLKPGPFSYLDGEPSRDHKPLVEARALFVEPKHAKVLKNLYRQFT